MITLEDAQTYKTFYHRYIRHLDGEPLRCWRTRKPKTWKRRPNEFEITVKYISGNVWVGGTTYEGEDRVSFYDYIATGHIPEYESNGRYWRVGKSLHSFQGPYYKSAEMWYSFDPTTLRYGDLYILRHHLNYYRKVSKTITEMPLPQLHDWLIENPQYNKEYNLGGWEQFTTPLAIVRAHMQAKQDGLPIRGEMIE